MTVPLVSVVLPVYNAEKYVGQAIQSIVAQSFQEWELIVVDDGSTDKSLAIVQSFSDPRIRVLAHGQNLGYPVAMNTGIECAKGKYVARMDSDDVSHPERLARQVAFLEEHPEYAFCFHPIRRIFEDPGRQPYDWYPPGRKATYRFDHLLVADNFIGTCSVVFRKGLFGGFPPWYFRMPQGDWPLHLLNAQHGDIGYLDEVMAVHRTHSGSTWEGLSHLEELSRRLRSRELVEAYLDLSGDQKRKIRLAQYVLRYRLAGAHAELGDRVGARSYIGWCVLHCHRGPKGLILPLVRLALAVCAPSLYRVFKDVRGTLVRAGLAPGRS